MLTYFLLSETYYQTIPTKYIIYKLVVLLIMKFIVFNFFVFCCLQFAHCNNLRGCLQRTSAKISDFQTTPSPCPGVSEFPKPPPPRTSASGFFQFLHFFYTFLFLLIKTKFFCPIPVFIKFKMLNTITFRE